MRIFARATAVGAAALTAGVIVIPTPASADPSSDFYPPPATLPSADGTLIRQQATPLGVSIQVPGMSGPLPAKATKIMYKSTDSNGQPVAVTGTYFEPTVAWTGSGTRPLVSLASGTIGQGDQCAPSRNLASPVNITGNSVSINYELIGAYSLLSKGVAVVMTDYVGLGTPDRLHTYVNRVDEGHAVLDAARAADSVDGASVDSTSKVGVYGYSQGGGAAASAAELQPTYAPDVNLVGAYAGAPPADLMATLTTIDGTTLTGAVGWAINGFSQSNPEVRAVIDANTNAAGKAALAKLSTMCVGDAVFSYAFQKSSSWTTRGQPLSTIITTNPTALAALADQKIGRRTPTVPVRIATGTADDFVPHPQARQLAVDWCNKGVTVNYVPYVQVPSLGLGVDHLAPMLQDMAGAQSWMLNRLTGKPAPNSCWAMPVLP